VQIDAYGAAGGNGYYACALGGMGGYMSVILKVSEGQQLYVYVGGKGAQSPGKTTNNNGGFNGGGQGWYGGGGGGGASDIRNTTSNLFSRLVVAGGGGGAGGGCPTTGGSGGGLTGVSGSGCGGAGGSQYAGGAAVTCNGKTSRDGSFGVGGKSDQSTTSGGGGGGYFGGAVGISINLLIYFFLSYWNNKKVSIISPCFRVGLHTAEQVGALVLPEMAWPYFIIFKVWILTMEMSQ
jgi:hypothetical protein